MTRIITITSGEAGVGKTAITTNLAAQLAQRGQRVCLLDADWGLSSAHRMLGLEPQNTLRELLLGEVMLEQVLIRNCHGFDIVPGSSGDNKWTSALGSAQLSRLAGALRELDDYDFLLIDTGSDMARHVLAFAFTSPELLLVITPQPSSLTETYELLKLRYTLRYESQIHLVVNKSRNHTVGRHTYDKFREITDFYLGAQLPLSAIIGNDSHMGQALQAQQPLVSCNPDSVAACGIAHLADRLLREQDTAHDAGMQEFLARYQRACGVETREVVTRDDENLQQQIEGLSTQVDKLIAEIKCLRGAAGPNADLYMLPRAGMRTLPERCSEVCVAMNTSVEEVTVQGETFSIYHIPRSNGDLQRFACHSLDDDLQQPRPQTTSS